MGRIACQENILLQRDKLNGIHIGDGSQQGSHTLFIPGWNRTHWNHNAFNGSTQQVHQIRNLVRTVNHRCSRQCNHLTVTGIVNQIVEFAGNVGRIGDA